MEQLNGALASALTDFVGNLDTARDLWQRYPELVEAKKLPEPFASAERDHEAGGNYSDEELQKWGILPAPAKPENEPGAPQCSDSGTPTLDERTLAELRRDVVQAVQGQGEGPNWQDYYHARIRFFASALVTENLDTHEAARLAVCQRLIREDRGCDTPIEEFLSQFLLACLHRPITIEDLKDLVNTAEQNFNDIIAVTKKMMADYPDLVCADTQEKSHV